MITLDPMSYKRIPIVSWEQLAKTHEGEFVDKSRRRVQWIFRGQQDSEWPLQPSLERAVLEWSGARRKAARLTDPDAVARINQASLKDGLEGEDGPVSVPVIEHRILREFKRRAQQYLDPPRAHLEWLSLMRHHQAPVRLLDWTYSFWVALHFALEESEADCAVWALDSDWVGDEAITLLSPRAAAILSEDRQVKDEETFWAVFLESTEPFVLPIAPFRLNERLTLQQGVFVCQSDVTCPFEDNLRRMLRSPKSEGRLIKIEVPDEGSLRREVRLRLERMNVSDAVLFPGVDGFARSLRNYLMYADVFLRSEESRLFHERWKARALGGGP